jgi:hypothetical protein
MQNNKWLWFSLIFALLLTGFIIGWSVKPSGKQTGSGIIKIHDTLKTTSVQYKIIPGTLYNIDSLITVINQFWKDSLKTMYGKGLFEAKYSKEDELGKREYTFESRIPLDPESQLIVNESFVFPKRTFALVGSIGRSCALGLKYYFLDHKNYSLSGIALGDYEFVKKTWTPNAKIELEYRF